MAEFRISRIRYTWKGTWGQSVTYQRDDVVSFGGSSYVCLVGHTAASNFYDDLYFIALGDTAPTPRWVKMTDGFFFRGDWQSGGTAYGLGDVVEAGGKLYLCTVQHSSDSTAFRNDASNWTTFASTEGWANNWAPATNYEVGDLVRWGGIVYKCKSAHLSTSNSEGLYGQIAFWDNYIISVEWVDFWRPSILYKTNDLVRYQGTLHRCTDPHTSTATFDPTKFTVELLGSEYESTWSEDSYYGIGSVVQYGGYLYRANFSHAGSDSAHTPFNSIYQAEGNPAWSILSKGNNWRGAWSSAASYKTGDVVRRGGNLYVALLDNVEDGSTLDYLDASNWELILEGQNYAGTWTSATTYFINDVVVYKGSTYKANIEHTASLENFPGDNGSGFNYWDILIQGDEFGALDTQGQLLTFDLNRTEAGDQSTLGPTGLDIGNQGQVLSATSVGRAAYRTFAQQPRHLYVSPNGSDDYDLPVPQYITKTITTTYQEIPQPSGIPTIIIQDDGYYYVGGERNPTITLERGNVYIFDQSDPSNKPHPLYFSADNFNGLNAGGTEYAVDITYKIDGAIVTFSNYIALFSSATTRTVEVYTTANTPTTLYYVCYSHLNMGNSITLIDNTANIGGTLFKPFRTVRYALERADDGYTGHTTVHVETGLYEEVLPMIVPARTVVLGAELRSTAISAAGAIASLADDAQYTILTLTRIKNLMSDVLSGAAITKSTSNTEDPVVIRGGSGNNPILISSPTVTNALDLIDDMIQYINFYINSTGSDVTVTGTNTKVTDLEILNTVRVLLANRTFFEKEAVAYMQDNFPDYPFDGVRCARDMRKYIDAIAYDLYYTGNYKSIIAARLYKNAVLGSTGEDMFYLRDATGVRNCTLKGLSGSLNPPNVFDLYRRPTGGAFCSLDPGWGTADNRCWINTRSPYIQGVTTIGTACVGQKIDGFLHDGGNKSMVSNDFTQVLSDGIGAFVLNGGRAELVSVFTYYNQVGYLAENGGVIRATNGNCSYGRFGAIADGIDNTETPTTATVSGRTGEAIVDGAFSGDFAGNIKLLEYTNAGTDYHTATATIIGSGSSISTEFDEFRDNAVFEARLQDASDSTVQVGGGGYVTVAGNAQVSLSGFDDTLGITISTQDSQTESAYLGMRILITSGTGTGQFGTITAYNISNKQVLVKRESDDQAGWDNVIPGTPVVTQFDTSTSYVVEPTPQFTAPPYQVSNVEVSTSAVWNDVIYSETTRTYTNVVAALGTGDVVEEDGLSATGARFNVTRSGRTYSSVTLANGGAGYAVGDEVAISGSTLGGEAITNDITITVTAVSDDSTNNIVSYTYEGTPTSGTFVAVPIGSATGLRSTDGETWNTFTMPSSGEWFLSKGDNRIVAVRGGTTNAAYSDDGITWTNTTLPASTLWNGVAYGQGVHVAISSESIAANNAAYSIDNGETWTTMNMPTIGDSSTNEWQKIAYGKGKFVAVANSNNVAAVGEYDSDADSWTWTGHVMDVIDDSSQKDWIDVEYGNNRFVAVSTQGDVAYSFDGDTWYGATLPTQDGSTAHNWRRISYGQGVFFAVGTTGGRDVGGIPNTGGPSTFAATSYDGIVWTPRELASERNWEAVAFGNPYIPGEDSTATGRTGTWVVVATGNRFQKAHLGAKALGRVQITSGRIAKMKLWEPGSGYNESPTLTLVDPSNTSDAIFDNRIGDGVLAQPSFINRGSGYKSSTTRVTVTGSGFADVIPVGKFVTVKGLTSYPGPGAQITFNGEDQIYTMVSITELGENYLGTEGFSARLRVSPEIKVRDNFAHDTVITIRQQYSQCRISGHDFLDIGTGNFAETNYPELYATGLYTPAPENEVIEETGGKVFYTSTYQSGNFRTGELFAVEQATGIVTISADFFDLSGLTELRLGGIRVGGSGVIIREFSTDPLFTEDSNNIIPTQRSIAAYLANRLSIGGSELTTESFIAGNVLVGPALINNVLSTAVRIPKVAKFEGDKAQIDGSILAQTMFHRSFDNEF